MAPSSKSGKKNQKPSNTKPPKPDSGKTTPQKQSQISQKEMEEVIPQQDKTEMLYKTASKVRFCIWIILIIIVAAIIIFFVAFDKALPDTLAICGALSFIISFAGRLIFLIASDKNKGTKSFEETLSEMPVIIDKLAFRLTPRLKKQKNVGTKDGFVDYIKANKTLHGKLLSIIIVSSVAVIILCFVLRVVGVLPIEASTTTTTTTTTTTATTPASPTTTTTAAVTTTPASATTTAAVTTAPATTAVTTAATTQTTEDTNTTDIIEATTLWYQYNGEILTSVNSIPDTDELVIPEDIQIIGESAFSGMNLRGKTLVLTNVREIQKDAFKNCNPDAVKFSGNLERIESYAFWVNEEDASKIEFSYAQAHDVFMSIVKLGSDFPLGAVFKLSAADGAFIQFGLDDTQPGDGTPDSPWTEWLQNNSSYGS